MRCRIALLSVVVVLGATTTARAAEQPLSWGVPVLANEAGGGQYRAIDNLDCPTPSLCVATDVVGNVLTTTDPLGSRSWTSRPVSSGSQISALDCLPDGFCVATNIRGTVLTSSLPAFGVWARHYTDKALLRAVDCASRALCVASDAGGNVWTSTNPASGGWTRAHVRTSTECDGPGPWACYSGGEDIPDVACPSARLCVATTNSGEVITSTNPTGGSDAWTQESIDDNTGPCHVAPCPASLDSIDCPAESLCVIAQNMGVVYTSGQPPAGAASWIASSYLPGLSREVDDLECVSRSLCFVVEHREAGVSTNPETLAPVWSPVQGLPRGITSIACLSELLCVAADQDGNVRAGVPMPALKVSTRMRTLVRTKRRAFSFRAPTAGRVTVEWRHGKTLVARGSKVFNGPGLARFSIRVTSRGRKLMQRSKTLAIDASATFGTVATVERFALKR